MRDDDEKGEVAGKSAAHVERYLDETALIVRDLDRNAVSGLVDELVAARERGGRIFFIGSGGGAGHASHAVCDFRKIGGFEAYSVTDNVSELTARINDDGWETSYMEWLRASRLDAADVVFVFSVGGGDRRRNVSTNLVRCIDYACELDATVLGVVGRDGGYTATAAKACVIVPSPNPNRVTAHTEAFQAVVWHLIVSDPRIQRAAMKWEGIG